VDAGLIELPTIERRIELDRDTTSRERIAARARIELAAVKTIMRSGCASTWEFIDPRTVKVTFTPLSEQDAGDIDQFVPHFAREIAALFTSAPQAIEVTRASQIEEEPSEEPALPPAPEAAKKTKTSKASSRTASPSSPSSPPRSKGSARTASSSGAKRASAKRSEVASEAPPKRTKKTATTSKASASKKPVAASKTPRARTSAAPAKKTKASTKKR